MGIVHLDDGFQLGDGPRTAPYLRSCNRAARPALLPGEASSSPSHVAAVIRAQEEFINCIPDIVRFYSKMPGEITWFVGGQESTGAELTLKQLEESAPGLPLKTVHANSLGDKYQRSIPVQDAWNHGDVLCP
jgi:hypothetical protein